MSEENIAIVTDSTSELVEAQLKAHDIYRVPLKIYFGQEEYWDREQLSPDDFYAKLKTSKEHPRTTQPTSKKFLELFQHLEDNGYTHILCILISSGISKTVEAAEFASAMVNKAKIKIVDTRGTSYGLAFLSMYARSLAKQGETFDAITEKIETKKKTTLHLFSVGNLNALERGGRIGKASAIIGNLLGVRPILAFNPVTGKIEVADKVNSTQAANEAMAQLARDHVNKNGLIYGAGIMNCDIMENCQSLKQILIQKGFQPGQLYDGRIGAVVGTHLGAQGWGLVVC